MSDTEVRDLFEMVLADPPPDTTDIEAAIRTGDRRRKHRVTAAVLSSAAAVVLIGIVVAATIPSDPNTHPAVTGTASPPPVALTGSVVTDSSQLLGSWLAVQLGDRHVSAARDRSGNQFELTFTHDTTWQWHANDACNEEFGGFAVAPDGAFRATEVGGSYVACLADDVATANVTTVLAADQANIIPSIDGLTAQLLLSKNGVVTGLYGRADPHGQVVAPSPQETASADAQPVALTGSVVTDRSQLLGTWLTVQLGDRVVTNQRDRSGDPLYLLFSHIDKHWWWGANDGCNNTSGDFNVVRAGTLVAVGGATTAVGCSGGLDEPDNVATPQAALQANIIPASGGTPARLLLSAQGKVIGVYDRYDHPRPEPNAVPLAQVVATGTADALSEPLSGHVTVLKGGCAGLDGRMTLWPTGTTWSGLLGVLLLPDGTPVARGQSVTGVGATLPAAEAQGKYAVSATLTECTWTDQASVFNGSAAISSSS